MVRMLRINGALTIQNGDGGILCLFAWHVCNLRSNNSSAFHSHLDMMEPKSTPYTLRIVCTSLGVLDNALPSLVSIDLYQHKVQHLTSKWGR